MTYMEWQECYDFAKKKVAASKDMNIEVKPYFQYNGAKGFEIQLWDKKWKTLLNTVYTGVWNDKASMINAIENMVVRIACEEVA